MVTRAAPAPALILVVRSLQARELEPLADPLGKFVEVEGLVEHDARAAVLVPADLALDRPQAFDDDDHLLADAIFLDRLDLHAAKRNVVHVHAIVELADPDRCLARNLETRRARTEAVARLAPCKQLPEI